MLDKEQRRLKRLTHEPPQGMYESLHNTAFVREREVYLRGVGANGEDISLCHYCATQCKERCGTEIADVSADEFGEFMDCECPVSLLYFIAVGAAEMREKLMRFEDAAESGAGLNALARDVHKNAVDHGWWETEREFGTIIALCHSELSEALEEHRRDKPPLYFSGKDASGCTEERETPFPPIITKPEGVAVELADCIIRILDYCGHAGIDIEEAIRIKHEYNKSRPYRHGGKVC